MFRVRFWTLVLACLCVATVANGAGRVVILGFDGMDPGLIEEMMRAGELPNFAKLKTSGTFNRLATSNPPQSPTAWSSFATCKSPLNHGIYDFLRRDPKTYFPGVGFGSVKRPDLAPDGALAQKATYQSHRNGETFWKVASDAGKRVKALVVPFAYPAEELGDGCMQLCGLDVQDLRHTQSTYFALGESFKTEEAVPGGLRLPLNFSGNNAVVQVPGIQIPGKPRGTYAEVPLTITADRSTRQATIQVGQQSATLNEGDWSEWLEWSFPLSPKVSIPAISRFYLMSAGSEVRLYMTCLQYHPKAPLIPISTPESYAGKLAERYGLYKTVGWAYDTKAFEQGDMTAEMFLEDIERTMAWRARLVLDELDRDEFDLLLGAWTATDRVSHMFWAQRDPDHPGYTAEGFQKYGRAVEDTYQKADKIVGEVMGRIHPEDMLMVMSDHGFHSFRHSFSVNTWLAQNGYLAFKDPNDRAAGYTEKKYLMGIDWTRTQAYGLGLGMVFLNLQGREKLGTVSPTAAPALLAEIKEKLLAVKDPDSGAPVFRNVYVNIAPKGDAAADAPDLQLGYAEGYQTAKSSAAGAAPKELFAPNLKQWSGEHASSDVAFTAGIFFCNRKVSNEPSIRDLGVTSLAFLGVPPPPDFEGKDLRPPAAR